MSQSQRQSFRYQALDNRFLADFSSAAQRGIKLWTVVRENRWEGDEEEGGGRHGRERVNGGETDGREEMEVRNMRGGR